MAAKMGRPPEMWDSGNEQEQEVVSVTKHNQLLTKFRGRLVESLRLDDMWYYLRQYNVVSRVAMEDLMYDAPNSHQVERLLDYITRCPTWCFHAFMRAMAHTRQGHLIRLLGLDLDTYIDPSTRRGTRGEFSEVDPGVPEANNGACRDGNQPNLNEIPEELRDLPPEILDAYMRACRDGTQPVNHTRIMICGHYGVGKTSVKNRLLDLDFCEEHNITNGAELSDCRVNITNISSNWTTIKKGEGDLDEYDEGVARSARSFLQRSNLENPVQHDTALLGSAPTGIPQRMEPSTPKEIAQVDPGSTAHTDPSRAPRPSKEMHRKLLNIQQGGAEKDKSDATATYSLWDFGGQAIYYTVHQMFLTRRAIYLVVLNLVELLWVTVDTHGNGPYRAMRNRTCPQTVGEFLEYWLNCIYTHLQSHGSTLVQSSVDKPIPNQSGDNEPTPEPSVLIVLTHLDELNKNPETAPTKIEEYKASIREHIEGKPYAKHIYQEEFFTVANNDKDDLGSKALREMITSLAKKQPYWDEEIPLTWVALRKRLREVEEGGTYVIILTEVERIAVNEGIHKDDVSKVLKFYHEIGQLVFYDDSDTKQVVILNPQWLLNAFCKIMTMQQFQEEERKDDTELWADLDNHGVLHEGILEKVWDKDYKVNKRHLIAILSKYRLLLPMRLCIMGDVYKGFKESASSDYMVPSLLPPFQQSDDNATDSLPPVLIQFKEHFMPIGICSCLISRLVSEEGWLLQDRIYNNCASFLPGGTKSHTVIRILQSCGQLEIQCKFPQIYGQDHILWPYLLKIKEQLQNIIRMSCPSAEINFAVCAPCHRSGSHVVCIGSDGEQVKCRKTLRCDRHAVDFASDPFWPWFKLNEITSSVNEITLKKVANELGGKWHGLCYRLLDKYEVCRLCTPIYGGPELYGVRMLIKWHQKEGLGNNLEKIKRMVTNALLDSKELQEDEDKREDLLSIVKDHKDPNENILFLDLSMKLVCHWCAVGLKLGLSRDVLDAIKTIQVAESDPAFKMLSKWNNATESNHKEKLINALNEEERYDIVDKLGDWGWSEATSGHNDGTM